MLLVYLVLYDDLKSATRFRLQGCNQEPHAHWRTGGGFNPPSPRNTEDPPKSCHTQSDFENC